MQSSMLHRADREPALMGPAERGSAQIAKLTGNLADAQGGVAQQLLGLLSAQLVYLLLEVDPITGQAAL